MSLVRSVIMQVALLALLFGVSLSGVGMERAHDTMNHAASDVAHHTHDHADMNAIGTQDTMPDAHQDHAACPMIACCHTGGLAGVSFCPDYQAVTAQFTQIVEARLAQSDPEHAKKPPKHI